MEKQRRNYVLSAGAAFGSTAGVGASTGSGAAGLLSAGFASVAGAAGAAGVVAGAAGAGVVSVGAVSVLVGSVTGAVAAGSSVFVFLSFFLKMPRKTFFTRLTASGAVWGCHVSLDALNRGAGV